MTIASAAAMLNLFNGLWLDGELYNFHGWFDMIYILIMHLGCVSFILWLKSKVKLEWSWFPFVYMASFLDPRLAAVGDLVQQKLS